MCGRCSYVGGAWWMLDRVGFGSCIVVLGLVCNYVSGVVEGGCGSEGQR